MAVITKGGTPVLGLDIGAAYIKAVELRPSKGALAITGVGVLPTPPGCIVNDEIVDTVVLAQAVKQLLAESGIKTKNVVTSVAGQSSVVVRVIEVPKMNDKELAETMRWEIDRHIPFAPEEVVKDYSPIVRPTDDPESPNMAVLLAVAQNGLVAGTLQTILNAGLTPVAIDVESLAGARSVFDVDDAFLSETVALVNIGASKTDVAIYEGGSLAFPRTIPVAGNAMTEAVANTLGIDPADAERLKKQHGAVPPDASERFGQHTETTGEEHFSFGDFEFGSPGAETEAPAGPDEFASTAEGPVFGSPFADTAEGPVFGGYEAGEPTITGPSFSEPEPEPGFGTPTVEPAPTDTFAAPASEQAAEGPSFEMTDMGPANTGPVFDTTPEFAAEETDTPPVVSPQEPVALTPDEAPVQAPRVPEVVGEAARHRAEISDAFMPVVAELAAEIKRSLEYYSSRANNATVNRVVLFGGVANLPGLLPFLERELEAPVQLAGLPAATALATKAFTADYLQQVAAMLPVAVGLASRGSVVVAPPAYQKAA